MKLINANILYAKAAAFETQALAYIQTLDPTEDHEKWVMWTAILNERTTFKHDVADAPSVERHGRWEVLHHFEYRCSQCGEHWNTENGVKIEYLRYCPRCGARMNEEEE